MMCLSGLRAAAVWWLVPAIFVIVSSRARAEDSPSSEASSGLSSLARRIESKRTSTSQATDATPPPRPATASSANFLILVSPDGRHAARILEEAEACRRRVAREWLGKSLPEGRPLTFIDVQLASDKDTGLTLPPIARRDDSPRIWLASPDEEALRHALAHEMVHVVMLQRFPAGMPAWANEGAASLEDTPVRVRLRWQLLAQWNRTDVWPSLSRLLERESIAPSDLPSYAHSASLVEYLTQKDSREVLLKFVAHGQSESWNAAVRRHYGVENTTELERDWRHWVRQRLDAAERSLSTAARIRARE